MIFDKGRTRFVIAFPKLGIAIKLPIIHFSIFPQMIKSGRNYGVEICLCMWKIDITSPQSYKYQLFGGFYANWMERMFWLQTKYPVLHPTWFSFFGIFNIQKYGKPLPENGMPVGQLVDEVTNGASKKCGHGLESSRNYTEVSGGQIRIIDYGSPNTWPVIHQYGDRIMKITVAECLDLAAKSEETS